MNAMMRLHAKLRGYRTLAFGAAVAALPPVLDYLNVVNWQTLGIKPTTGVMIGAAIIGLRAATKSPVFKQPEPPTPPSPPAA